MHSRACNRDSEQALYCHDISEPTHAQISHHPIAWHFKIAPVVTAVDNDSAGELRGFIARQCREHVIRQADDTVSDSTKTFPSFPLEFSKPIEHDRTTSTNVPDSWRIVPRQCGDPRPRQPAKRMKNAGDRVSEAGAAAKES
ncbi:hypothetical protein [Crateriforma conspicua]|uniref:hypothetical protein n=1 Tax=Crateriforma conspicua TaxID=2527996 RepID=UPI0018CC7F8C|nr:hypothetical protein [Crateriforma conspicua]